MDLFKTTKCTPSVLQADSVFEEDNEKERPQLRRMRSQSTPIGHKPNIKEKAHRPFTPQPTATNYSLFELAQVFVV